MQFSKLIINFFRRTIGSLWYVLCLIRPAKRKKIISYYKGILSEYFCMILLLIRGYKIIARRLKTKFGEIDILATKSGITVVFEAKYRSSGIDDAKFALLSSNKRVRKAYISLKRRGKVEFRYFVQSGFKFEFGSMN